MKKKSLFNDGFIIFDEAEHKYTDINKKQYCPMTQCCSNASEPFDAEQMSRLSAKSILGWNTAKDEEIELYAEALRREWIMKAKVSTQWGHAIHSANEKYGKYREVDSKLFEILTEIAYSQKINIDFDKFALMLKKINDLYSEYSITYDEELLYDKVNMVSGITDKCCLRQKTSKVIDFFDYKTNFFKGIYFDSIKREEDNTWKKHSNRYYKQPFAHLEKCNYLDYCFQLSGYARMSENFDFKPGRLALIEISHNFDFKVIPVPYMRSEAEWILSSSPYKLVSTEAEW